MQDSSAVLPAPYVKGDRVPLLAGLGYLVLLAIFWLFLYYLGLISLKENGLETLIKAFGVISLVVLMNLANAYLYAYRFYEEVFFLFISLGWFANALYLIFEFFPPTTKTLGYSEKVFLFALLTNVPFYFAIFTRREESFAYGSFFRNTLFWIALVGASVLGSNLLGNRYELSDPYRFMIFAIGGIGFSAWLFFNVGWRLRERLSSSIHGRVATILPWTFYLYGGLQFVYFSALMPGWNKVMLAAFFTAFLLKVLNTLSVISILTVTRQEFIQVKAQLKQRSAFEEIGRIASSIEHDIKTPLGIMSFEIARMRNRFQANADIVDALERIEHEQRRVYAISEVVPYLRGDKEFFERYMEKTDALQVVHKAVKDIKKDLKLNPSQFYFKVDGRAEFVKCHRSMLEQALVNILKNSVEAIRLARRKTGLIVVSLRLTRGQRMVSIAIEDNGCGIAEENIPELTTLYTTKRHVKPNSGIGLFIANKIVKMHEGMITIESKLGEGTTVYIGLPEWVPESETTSESDAASNGTSTVQGPDLLTIT